MKKILCAVVLLTFALIVEASAVELSADVIMRSKGGELSSKMYIKAGKFRADVQNQSGYHIIRQDRNLMWIVLPDSKSYMEIRYNQEKRAMIEEKVPGEVSRRSMGSEVIDGHPTVKYEITYEDDAQVKKKIYQWMATDIQFPVKVSAVDGSWTNEYKNITIGPVPDTLFEIPAGFERMTIPEMQV